MPSSFKLFYSLRHDETSVASPSLLHFLSCRLHINQNLLGSLERLHTGGYSHIDAHLDENLANLSGSDAVVDSTANVDSQLMNLAGSGQHGKIDEGAVTAGQTRSVPDGTPAESSGELLHGLGELGAAVLQGVVDVGIAEDATTDGHAHLVEGLLKLGAVGHFEFLGVVLLSQRDVVEAREKVALLVLEKAVVLFVGISLSVQGGSKRGFM